MAQQKEFPVTLEQDLVELSPAALPQVGLNDRQIHTVRRLLSAARRLVAEPGTEDLTLRAVAAEAGFSAATAYTYFSSKDHLFAVLFWNHVATAPRPELSGTVEDRIRQTARFLADLVAADPVVAAAATKSMLVIDSDVDVVRRKVGRHWSTLFRTAAPDVGELPLRVLGFTFSGALLEAGMGVIDHADLSRILEEAMIVVLRGAGATPPQ